MLTASSKLSGGSRLTGSVPFRLGCCGGAQRIRKKMRTCVRVCVCEYPVTRPAESDLLLHTRAHIRYECSSSSSSESLDSRSVTLDELSVMQLHQSGRGHPRRRRRCRRR